jgi:hypothetical protein
LANGHRLYPMTRSSTHRNVAVLTSSGEGGDALDAAEATAREGRGLARGPARATEAAARTAAHANARIGSVVRAREKDAKE